MLAVTPNQSHHCTALFCKKIQYLKRIDILLAFLCMVIILDLSNLSVHCFLSLDPVQ